MTDKEKGGRPTDYNEELAVDICNHIAGGKSLRSFVGVRALHMCQLCVDGCTQTKDLAPNIKKQGQVT